MEPGLAFFLGLDVLFPRVIEDLAARRQLASSQVRRAIWVHAESLWVEVVMRLAWITLGASFALAVHAADTKEQDPHAQHQAEAAGATPSQPSSDRMQSMMKSMQEMHQKMMAAKTPEERTALMQEHMKMMHGCMAMMGGGPKAASP